MDIGEFEYDGRTMESVSTMEAGERLELGLSQGNMESDLCSVSISRHHELPEPCRAFVPNETSWYDCIVCVFIYIYVVLCVCVCVCVCV